ncbi:MAG: protein kinase, partial [Polyangiaceae bacterium]|nr:protein kinase [Polyangiaceae bacterium]
MAWTNPSLSQQGAPQLSKCQNCGQLLLAGTTSCSQCGTAVGTAAPPPGFTIGELPRGFVINNMYRIDAKLGEGGMGIVYRATDINTNLSVVVKAIRPEFSSREDYKKRILTEGTVLANINHQHVVPMRAVIAEAGTTFLILQYIEGESLDKTLARYGKEGELMPVEDALSIFLQVLQGLGAAHNKGVIHRDIKPGNIMIQSSDSTALVTDFGIAKDQKLSAAATNFKTGVIGSPHYFSPEQITADRNIDRRTDIYSLGIMLFEMLAGKVPFDGASQFAMMKMHTDTPIPSIRASRPEVPAHVETAINKACEKDRENRFASTAEMACAILDIPFDPKTSGAVPLPPISLRGSRDQSGTGGNTTGGSTTHTIGGSASQTQNTKKRNIIILTSAASIAIIAAVIGFSAISTGPTCQTNETACGKACCNNNTSECVDGSCACKPGAPCENNKVCDANHACVDGCLIDGKPFLFGSPNPYNACQVCANSSPTAWKPSPKGTPCKNGGSACNAMGTCVFTPSIAAGDDFTCGVTKDGTVLCWGNNKHGQLGAKPADPEASTAKSTRMQVADLSSIASITVG